MAELSKQKQKQTRLVTEVLSLALRVPNPESSIQVMCDGWENIADDHINEVSITSGPMTTIRSGLRYLPRRLP
jgi:hypothetical protein